MTECWKYYNHALIPAIEPHIECIPPKNKHAFWRIGGGYTFICEMDYRVGL